MPGARVHQVIVLSWLLLNSFAVSFAVAQKADQQTLQTLEKVRQKYGLVGITCCAIKDGKVVAIGSVGERKFGSGVKLQVDDKLHLGSCTKAMTATLIAQLVAEKKIKWSTKLLDVFPNLEKEIHKEYHQVSILDLITHKSGVPKNNVKGWPKGRLIRSLRFELIKQSLKPKPENKVGEYFYSNLGYITAGAMLEKITNKKWEHLIQTKLFDKLGMKSAGFGPPGIRYADVINGKSKKSDKIKQPWGHEKDKEGNWIATRIDNPPILGPAGTVHCSIEDWAKFVSLHISWANRKPELLDVEALKFLQTPKTPNRYACGWFAVDRYWGRGRVISHNGSNTYWMANVWASPKKDFAVMTVTNCCAEETATHIDEIANAMIRRFAR